MVDFLGSLDPGCFQPRAPCFSRTTGTSVYVRTSGMTPERDALAVDVVELQQGAEDGRIEPVMPPFRDEIAFPRSAPIERFRLRWIVADIRGLWSRWTSVVSVSPTISSLVVSIGIWPISLYYLVVSCIRATGGSLVSTSSTE
jgi:hypothetical protein